MLLQVIQQALTLTNQLHETPVGREVFFVDLQVLADVADALSQQGNLPFNGTGILGFTGVGLENVRFFLSC